MPELSRRQHLKQLGALAGTAAMSSLSASVFAADTDIPPQGIGKGIKHISYSDIGGRPDSVQVMVNKKHVYVGHMFSDGVTILDASDPRNLKPTGFFTAGKYTRTHHLQVSDDLMLLANGKMCHASNKNAATLSRRTARVDSLPITCFSSCPQPAKSRNEIAWCGRSTERSFYFSDSPG